MRTITATEFKAKCLQILDEVHETGEVVRVTKHGKVVARVGPVEADEKPAPIFGSMKGLVSYCGDLTEPLDVEWEALHDDS